MSRLVAPRGWAALATLASLLVFTGATYHVLPHAFPSVAGAFFQTGGACMACHNGLSAPTGEDVSIGASWRASIMANSARDPYWQATVRRETFEHPKARAAIEDECSTCHMPMMRAEAHARGEEGRILDRLPLVQAIGDEDRLAADGVSCTLCHQIHAAKLGTPASFNGGFVIDTTAPLGERRVFGPYDVDAGRQRVMHSSSRFVPAKGAHVQSSELCATCHTLYTSARDDEGNVVGRLPEQMPYLEWKASAYSSDEGGRTCQSCHMPTVVDSTPIASVLGLPRAELSRHTFLGGNFFMLRMLAKYRGELGVEALPAELESAARLTIDQLARSSASLSLAARVERGRILADVEVRNITGHKLPTGYPSRRAWLHVVVRDRGGRVVFESGAMAPTGAIAGNDADDDPTRYEPHYQEITRADQVQIYESVMVDHRDRVTTQLLRGVRFVKDNRLLPTGFAKSGAPDDIAVRGDARDDPDFAGGADRVRYAIDVSRAEGPFRIRAELRFQPIAFRWAKNLAQHYAEETRRFGTWYDAMADASSTPLAADSADVR